MLGVEHPKILDIGHVRHPDSGSTTLKLVPHLGHFTVIMLLMSVFSQNYFKLLMKSLLDMSRRIVVKLSKYLSDKTGFSETVLCFDRDCVSVRDVLEALFEKAPVLREESLMIIREGKIIPLSATICEDCELEIVQSLVGG